MPFTCNINIIIIQYTELCAYKIVGTIIKLIMDADDSALVMVK